MLSGTRTWLKQTVTVKPFTGLNDYAEPSYGTGASVACRIQQTDEQVIGADNTLIHATAKILMDGSASVSVSDKVTLPNGEEKPILKLNAIAGPAGTDYLKVLYV
jgi:hypothetical protein